MKKFLSAFTAFCMSASIVASALPASALTPILNDVPKAQADVYAWDIEDEVRTEDINGMRVAFIDVYVWNDEGTNGYSVDLDIEGKEFSDLGMELLEIAQGDAYPKLATFVSNPPIGSAGAANSNKDDQSAQFAANGAIALTYTVIVPDTVEDGVYKLTFNEDTQIGGEGVTMHPELMGGSLIVGDVEPDPTTAPTTEGNGDATEPTVGADEYAWDIEDDVQLEEVNGMRVAFIDVYVWNDKGTNGYSVDLDIEDGEFADLGMELLEIAQGDAYPKLSTFVSNPPLGTAGAANADKDDQSAQFAANGATVLTYTVIVPDTVKDGVYTITFNADTKIGGEGVMMDPKLLSGSLIVGEATTEPTTEATEPTEPTTEPPVVDGYAWDIENDVQLEDVNGMRVAYIDIFVLNDQGTNGYSVDIDIEGGEFADLGMNLLEITQGDAYPKLTTFVSNPPLGTAGAANADKDDQSAQFAANGATVLTYTVIVPDTVKDGVYTITFNADTKIGGEGVMMNPQLLPGSLIVGDVEDPQETTEATEESEFVAESSKIDAEWYIGTVEAEAGAVVTVPVRVKGDVDGINSYVTVIGADGPAIKDAEAGSAYSALNFVYNLDTMAFGATNYSLGENVVAEENEVVFNMHFEVPADAAPGTVYPLTFEDLEIYNIEMVQLIPTTTDGWIKVPEKEETEFTSESKEIDAEWIIGTTEAAAGSTVTIPVTVKGDVDGINSYILNMGQDAGPVAKGAEAGDAYAALNFVYDLADLEFAGTNYTEGANVVAADGAVVFNVTFDVPADAAPGTIYDLTFEGLELYDINMVQLIPNTTDGWIKVPDEKTTEAAGEWIIGTAVAEPGETVTIPVTVKGDLNGINSYILDMGQDAGPVANDAAKGDAYAALDFIFNMDNLTFAGTNYTLGENVVPADDAVVFNVTFKVPDDAAPGTIYNLTFEGLTVYDINMNELNPEKVPGWIKIADEESTTEPTDTTPVATPAETTTTPATSDTPAATTTTPATSDTPAATTTTPATSDTPAATTTTTPATSDTPAATTTTTPATSDTPANTTETTETTKASVDTPVDPPVTIPPEEAGQWIIGTTVVEAGATVTIPVTVKGDKNGINSFIFDMGQDAGPVANDAAEGDAYAALDFIYNLDNLTFAGTNYALSENVIAADGAVVLNVTFKVPDDAAPGTVYNLTFEGLEVYDINMNVLQPEQIPGWIKIADEESTTVPTDTTPVVTDTTPVVTDTTPVVTDTTPVVTDTTPATTETTPVTTTTTTTATSATTTTTETTTTESQPVPGAATWQIGTVEAKPGQKVTVNVTVYGDTGLNSYQFKMNQDAGPTANAASAGNAYPTLGFEYALDTLTFGGTSTNTANVVAADGAVVVGVTFTVPEDAKPGTIYNLTFDGDVEAIDANMVALDITEVAGWIKVLDADVTVTGYEYEVVGKSKFYLSHDMRPFDPADLVTTVMQYTLYSDGTKSEGVELNIAEVTFDIPGWTNPEEVFNAQVLDAEGNPKADYDVYYKGSIPATITDPLGEVHNLPAVGTAYIAVKGDATLTGEADAKDAAIVLTYAAKKGAGMDAYIYSETDAELEAFAYFLTDVTGESEDNGATDSLGNAGSDCDAKDAAKILVYAAIQGSGKYADWAQILSEPLPKYTAAIDAYRKANA